MGVSGTLESRDYQCPDMVILFLAAFNNCAMVFVYDASSTAVYATYLELVLKPMKDCVDEERNYKKIFKAA